jgi:hypothetical protein
VVHIFRFGIFSHVEGTTNCIRSHCCPVCSSPLYNVWTRRYNYRESNQQQDLISSACSSSTERYHVNLSGRSVTERLAALLVATSCMHNIRIQRTFIYSAAHSRVAPENVGLQKEQKYNTLAYWFTFACHTCMKCGCHRRCWRWPPWASIHNWTQQRMFLKVAATWKQASTSHLSSLLTETWA